MTEFAEHLLGWHKHHGRTDLPWQQNITPYRVWVSEIMLQQTQVATVIDYYNRFMQRFPDVETLARADLDDVLHHWTGLGYYARARNLHKAAVTVAQEFNGNFPPSQEGLEALPGIGRSTAGAIRAIAFGQHASILDGNVKRVLTRYHAISGYPGTTQVTRELWALAEQHTPSRETARYTQAIMDLGATLCTRSNPACGTCPVANTCKANLTGKQGDYPEPKPKKDKPTRESRFFVIVSPDTRVLLEQRPPEGIWGGLWTPPQRDLACDATTVCDEFGIPPTAVAREHHAPAFRHTFTHFHLNIHPTYLHLEHQPQLVTDADTHRWYQPDAAGENQAIGLSAPAVKLLDSIKQVFAE